MTANSPNNPAARWTFDAFRLGALATLPMMPGLFAFGIAVGTVAARKGFTLFETMAMSGTVYAGMAQIIVLEAWPERLTSAAIVGAALVTGMVCMRFLLIGASLRPWLGHESPARVYPMLYLLTETNWLLSMRYRADGGSDPAFLLGSGVMVWVGWVAAAVPGYWLGASIGDPSRFALDLVMPVFFTAMLVSLWRGYRRALGWLVGGAAAVVAYYLFGGWWYVMVGAVAGSLVGGLVDDRK